MKNRFLILTAACGMGASALLGANPVLPGYHADPEILYSEDTGKYYIYSTTDGEPGWGGCLLFRGMA